MMVSVDYRTYRVSLLEIRPYSRRATVSAQGALIVPRDQVKLALGNV